MRTLSTALLIILVLAAPHPALSAIITDRTSQLEALRPIENWINRLETMQARFIQLGDDGSEQTGQFMVRRPGRMRFAYDPPSSVMMLANGTFFIFVDKSVRQVNHLFLSSTPIWFLLREKMEFGDEDYVIEQVETGEGLIRARFYKKDEREMGLVEAVFTTSPIELRQWRVFEASGRTSQVTLFDIEYGLDLDLELFRFDNPWIDKPYE